MGSFYANYIFPRLMEWVMAGEEFGRFRKALLAPYKARCWIGTGLNLPYLSLDDHRSSGRRSGGAPSSSRRPAQRRAVRPGEHSACSAETLPFADHTFDVVVSTWTLCSIPDPLQALKKSAESSGRLGDFCFSNMGEAPTKGSPDGKIVSIPFKTLWAVAAI